MDALRDVLGGIALLCHGLAFPAPRRIKECFVASVQIAICFQCNSYVDPETRLQQSGRTSRSNAAADKRASPASFLPAVSWQVGSDDLREGEIKGISAISIFGSRHVSRLATSAMHG